VTSPDAIAFGSELGEKPAIGHLTSLKHYCRTKADPALKRDRPDSQKMHAVAQL